MYRVPEPIPVPKFLGPIPVPKFPVPVGPVPGLDLPVSNRDRIPGSFNLLTPKFHGFEENLKLEVSSSIPFQLTKQELREIRILIWSIIIHVEKNWPKLTLSIVHKVDIVWTVEYAPIHRWSSISLS